MNNNVMLKWSRKARGLSQKQVADAVGLSHQMISRLELDHKTWDNLNESYKVKLNEFFEGSKGWEPLKIGTDEIDDTEIVENITEEVSVIEEPSVKHKSKTVKDNKLTKDDDKTLTLIEFAYEGLIEAKTHEDFSANISILRRILKKYGI